LKRAKAPLTTILHYNDFLCNMGAFPALRTGNRALRGSALSRSGPGVSRRVCFAPLQSLARLAPDIVFRKVCGWFFRNVKSLALPRGMRGIDKYEYFIYKMIYSR
jgi:hypothetical protein